MSLSFGLFSASLPDVGSEDISARSKNEMSSCMMSLKLSSPLLIHFSCDFFAFEVPFRQLFVEFVHNNLADLNYDIDLLFLCSFSRCDGH